MKNRICLAWFGDLDSTDRGIKLSRNIASTGKPSRAPRGHKRPPKMKEAEELRQMFGRR
jgi:hypothetical protein